MPSYSPARSLPPSISLPPEYLILDTRLVEEKFKDIEELIVVNAGDYGVFMHDLIKCMRKRTEVGVEVDYLCLELAAADHDHWPLMFDAVLRCVVAMADILLAEIDRHGLYRHGIFPYVMVGNRFQAVELIREDVLRQRLNAEFNQPEKANAPAPA